MANVEMGMSPEPKQPQILDSVEGGQAEGRLPLPEAATVAYVSPALGEIAAGQVTLGPTSYDHKDDPNDASQGYKPYA